MEGFTFNSLLKSYMKRVFKGIIAGIITGESSEIVRSRAKKLNIKEVHIGVNDKLTVINSLCGKHGIKIQNVAFIGDDLNDYEVICNVDLGMCVADSRFGLFILYFREAVSQTRKLAFAFDERREVNRFNTSQFAAWY